MSMAHGSVAQPLPRRSLRRPPLLNENFVIALYCDRTVEIVGHGCYLSLVSLPDSALAGSSTPDHRIIGHDTRSGSRYRRSRKTCTLPLRAAFLSTAWSRSV
jgi:hypothetical protein